ncbi:class I SAM-dependent methyltransferase [Nonomuraea sp. NPDC050153]|uniref:class I SAM-dependent methyltransferase n=1 Tax=Nonomuraea sp. NPDC050153 TaxID=3364359 RepID=UPI00378D8B5C
MVLDPYKDYLADLFDRAAGSYEQTGVAFFAPAGGRVVELGGLAAGERALDVGCGRGAVLVPAAEAVGEGGLVRGIDLSAGMLAHLRAELRRRGLGQALVSQGDAEKLDFPDGSFDVVFAGMVLFFLADARAAVRDWRRVLRPGGRLVMSTMDVRVDRGKAINDAALAAVAPFLGPDPRPAGHPGADDRYRTRESIEELLAGTGFGVARFVEETLPLRFAGPQEYWEWMGSSSMRVIVERVPPGDRQRAGRAVAAGLEPFRGVDGSVVLPMRMRYTCAVAE